MRHTLSFLGVSLALCALGLAGTGCQIIAGLGGEQPAAGGNGATGGGGNGTSSGGGGNGDGGGGAPPSCEPGVVSSCYSGPASTENVGLCVGGMSTCQDNGTPGVCEGEVVPATELCAAIDDENCDGHDCIQWAKAFTGDGYVAVIDIAVGSTGDIFTTGIFVGGIDFGDGDPLIATGEADIFVLRLSGNGDLIWKKGFGSVEYDVAWSMALDGADNVYIAGAADEALDFGGGPLVPSIFVAKLDPNGEHLWSVSGKGTNNEPFNTSAAQQIEIDPNNGDVLIAGEATYAIDFGSGPLAGVDTSDFFVARLKSDDGAPVWVMRSHGDASDDYQGFGLSSNGGMYLVVETDSMSVNLYGTTALTNGFNNCGTGTLLFLQIAPDGSVTASNELAGCDSAFLSGNINQVAIDKFGTPHMTGSYTGKLDCCTDLSPTSAGQDDWFLWKKVQAGTGWIKSFGDALDQQGTRLVLDPNGEVVVAGINEGSVDMGGGPIFANTGSGQIILARYDKDGNHLWSRGYGNAGFDVPYALALTPAGEVIMAGFFDTTIDFGSGELTGSQNTGYIAKLGK